MSDIGAKGERSRSSLALGLISKLGRFVNFSAAAIVVVALSSMFLAILANVILRYFFNSGLTWAYEIPSILFPWTVAGGLVMATVQGRNITVDVVAAALPERLRWFLAILVNLFTAAMSVGVVYYSMPIIKASQYSRLAETGIPQIYGYSSLLYAFSMIAFVATLTMIEFLMGRKSEAVNPTEANFS